MNKQQLHDHVFGFGSESKYEDEGEESLHVDGDIVCTGNIKGPSIEEIHKKIEEGQMSVDELESAVHYIVNMELKHIAIDIRTELQYASTTIATYTPSRVTEPEHILMEIDLMSNMIGKAISDAAYSILESFNNRLEKHGYNS
jgi:hypothetical protein